ncbi:MAG: 4,5-dihydroxyphthalate decarboxylase [Chloroflexota bacterium]|jgi:4,5-dihydroxyphthalate decarboxylase|nr:4,5-dihydroxyphthalate decarboxylase [Chloroflexota bacterium]
MTAATELHLEFPIMRYDITMPLLEGRVPIEGVRLRQAPAANTMVFKDVPALREGNFGLCDLNLGYLLAAIDAGWEITALPVFSKRKPSYQYIFCRNDVGIESPKDLEGKRIGTRSYPTALTIWNQGLLQDRYGVDHTTLRWVVALERFFPVHDASAQIEYTLDPKKSAADVLIDGDADAIITDISDTKLLNLMLAHPKLRRLFPSYQEEDERLYRETGIFAPVHLMVMSRKLDRAHPELARKLYDAFEQAKQLAYTDILNERGGFSVVYLREKLEEQMARWGDPLQYGIDANRGTLDTFFRYNVEQGIVRAPLAYEQVFAASTLDT